MNVAVWLSAFSPWLVGLSLLGAVALLASRRLAVGMGRLWLGLLLAQLVVAAVTLWRSRDSFFTTFDALVRLDATLGLHSRLASAMAGVGSWPRVPERVAHGVRWNWPRVVAPVAFSVALLAVAGSVPVAARVEIEALKPDPPVAWQEMQSWLAGLKERSLVEDQALQKWDQRLEELRRQPAKQWFSHSSLEASDSLRQELAGSVRTLGQEMGRAGRALETVEALPSAVRDEDLETLSAELKEAASDLETNALSMDKRLLEALKKTAPRGSMSQEQLKRLKELRGRLREGEGFCKIALRECKVGDPGCITTQARRPGGGSVERGPGTLPLTLDPERSELGTKTLAGMSNPDLSRATPGDLVGIGRSRHHVDRGAFHGLSAGGGIDSTGTGGEAVWRSSATPAEQKVLERYFK